jgi:hypothetical protein
MRLGLQITVTVGEITIIFLVGPVGSRGCRIRVTDWTLGILPTGTNAVVTTRTSTEP